MNLESLDLESDALQTEPPRHPSSLGFTVNVPRLFADEGSLRLYQVFPLNTVSLMNTTGDQGDLWHYWEANVNSSSYFQVRLGLLAACLPVCLCLSVCRSVCLSVGLSVCLLVCLPVSLSACLPACQSVSLTACLPVCLSASLSACLSVCLLVSLPVSRSV